MKIKGRIERRQRYSDTREEVTTSNENISGVLYSERNEEVEEEV